MSCPVYTLPGQLMSHGGSVCMWVWVYVCVGGCVWLCHSVCALAFQFGQDQIFDPPTVSALLWHKQSLSAPYKSHITTPSFGTAHLHRPDTGHDLAKSFAPFFNFTNTSSSAKSLFKCLTQAGTAGFDNPPNKNYANVHKTLLQL